jgi:hypothetical protein
LQVEIRAKAKEAGQENRKAALRRRIKRIWGSIEYLCQKVIIPLKLFAITIIIGLWGAWLVVNGILMAMAPKSERGDVADQ